MITIRNAMALAAVTGLLAGCAASTKTFYANPARVSDTQLCRTFIDAAEKGNEQFARDTAGEAIRRGLTLEKCQDKIATENAVLIGTAVVATAIGVGIACSQGCSGGGGGYSAVRSTDQDCLGGPGDGPYFVRGPVYVGSYDPHDLDRDGDGVGCELGDFGA